MNDIESPSFCPFCGAQPFVSKRASGDGYNYSQLSQREISRLKSICDNCYSDIRTATNERLELTRDDVVAQRQAHQNELAKKRNANAQGTISARPYGQTFESSKYSGATKPSDSGNVMKITGAALIMIGAFFMPWIEYYGVGMSGWAMARSDGGEGYRLFLVPVLASATLFACWNRWHFRLIAGLTGAVPIVYVLYAIIETSSSRSSFGISGTDRIRMLGEVVGFGVWLTILSAVALLVLALYPSVQGNNSRR